MLTYKGKDFNYSHGLDRVEGECLSTDTKPTEGIANGSCLIEMDTGDIFMFDGANEEWLNITNPGGGGGAEVWLVGDNPQHGEFALSNVDSVDHITELYNNSENYDVFLNGTELPYVIDQQGMIMWTNSETPADITKAVVIDGSYSPLLASASWFEEPTPTSVEVSVKAK